MYDQFWLIWPILAMYVTNCRSLKGLYRTFVLPTDPHFCEHIFWQSPKGFIKCEICIFFFFVAMLPCDSLIWMKYFQICHFPGRIIEFTALKIGDNVSLEAKSGSILPCNVYPVLNSSALLVKLNKFATKNRMCNDVTTVHICYISLILRLCFSKLSLYCIDQC